MLSPQRRDQAGYDSELVIQIYAVTYLHYAFTGFKGVWGSGLSVSAQLGVRDSNEASWTQVTEVLEFMSDATEIPILLDADTGYGNFNNARRLVHKLEKIGVAGMS